MIISDCKFEDWRDRVTERDREEEDRMELKGKFLTQFKVRQQPQSTTWLFPKRAKRKPLVFLSMFRETFPLSHARWKTLEVHCDNNQSISLSAVSRSDGSKRAELSLSRLQDREKECSEIQKRSFGQFVAREAMLDEEYWTAAWLRAEANWESLSYMRHVDSYKRKYAEREFYALKRRCVGRDGNSLKCFCFVAVKQEDKSVRTVLNSVVGTLDLSIRQLFQGETYPGAFKASPEICHLEVIMYYLQEVKRPSSALASQDSCSAYRYGYIANVCVSKFSRRQGIATNMLHLATDFATSSGMKQLFVHVNADNKPAQELYKRAGFQIVEAASSPLSKDQRLLMSMDL